MAASSPSSVKSEPTGGLYSNNEPNLSYSSIFDTSIENTLPTQSDAPTTATASIYIDAPSNRSSEPSFEALQGFSAPTLPVYINMGMNEHPDDVTFAGPITTANQPTSNIHMSRSLATIELDHPISAPAIQRHSHYHFPHHAQNRNRYPYLLKPTNAKGFNRSQGAPTSFDGASYLEQRPAFRRSYFALRRQRIPKGNCASVPKVQHWRNFSSAPPMPKHLFPGYRQNKTSTLATEASRDTQHNDEEDEDEGNSFCTTAGIRSLRRSRRSVLSTRQVCSGSKFSSSMISVCNRSQSVIITTGNANGRRDELEERSPVTFVVGTEKLADTDERARPKGSDESVDWESENVGLMAG